MNGPPQKPDMSKNQTFQEKQETGYFVKQFFYLEKIIINNLSVHNMFNFVKKYFIFLIIRVFCVKDMSVVCGKM